MIKKVLFVLGTRPEAIKLAPLIKVFESSNKYDVEVCSTGQHKEMLEEVLNFFDIKPDYDLKLMKTGQTLFDVTSKVLLGVGEIIDKSKPDVIFVQGDTTSVFASSLAAFYKSVKVAHIEAGLRTNNKLSPFPEEINRVLTGHIADFHLAPTQKAKQNLKNEGIVKNVFVTGNTVIDALFLALKKIKNKAANDYINKFTNINFNKKIILLTAHRRENFGKPFEDICKAIIEISQNEDVEIVYPVHPNPNIKEIAYKLLGDINNIKLISPLPYPELVWIMNKSHIVITDSGGIQEEAPSLGNPVLVLRNETERTEGIDAGTVKLVGTNKNKIIKEVTKLLNNEKYYNDMKHKVNPYGDGTASKKILSIFDKL